MSIIPTPAPHLPSGRMSRGLCSHCCRPQRNTGVRGLSSPLSCDSGSMTVATPEAGSRQSLSAFQTTGDSQLFPFCSSLLGSLDHETPCLSSLNVSPCHKSKLKESSSKEQGSRESKKMEEESQMLLVLTQAEPDAASHSHRYLV